MNFATRLTAAATLALLSGNLAAHAGPGWAGADRETTRVVIENVGWDPIETVNISSSSSSEWGRDLLGERMIPRGRQETFTRGAHHRDCFFDIRVIYETGEEQRMNRANLCGDVKISVSEFEIELHGGRGRGDDRSF